MTLFRPCIDLHEGKVKQIVGSSLESKSLLSNFVSEQPSTWFSKRYKEDGLLGGHLIMLGPGNEEAAKQALAVYPLGLQIGGGIHPQNAEDWLMAGASHVIVTSWLFPGAYLDWKRLEALSHQITKVRLVVDLSCRSFQGSWFVATHRWSQLSEEEITPDLMYKIADYCDEILIHAADVEGKCEGMDEELISLLARVTPCPITYAGGAKSLDDLYRVKEMSGNNIDLTIGSALDIFGGSGVRYEDCVAFNRKQVSS